MNSKKQPVEKMHKRMKPRGENKFLSTGSTPPLRFDFEAAVAQTLHTFPQLKKTALFASTADNTILNQDALKYMPEPNIALSQIKADIIEARSHKNSFANTAEDTVLITIYTGNDKSPFPVIEKYFSLDHEVAHVVIPQAGRPNPYPYVECVADAYAAIRCLQRFGNDAVDFLTYKSRDRADQFLATGKLTHLSTLVLDRIILDAAQGKFDGLNNDDVIKHAIGYANSYTPTQGAMRKTYSVFEDDVDFDRNEKSSFNLRILSSTALASGDNLAVYLAQRILLPFDHPNTTLVQSGLEPPLLKPKAPILK